MGQITVTAQLASSALRGEDVEVHLNGAQAVSALPNLLKGQACTISSSAKVGKISFVDYFGSSFQITPAQPNLTLESLSTPGYLASGELIQITT